jgi:hypothetical protein
LASQYNPVEQFQQQPAKVKDKEGIVNATRKIAGESTSRILPQSYSFISSYWSAGALACADAQQPGAAAVQYE